MRRHEGTRQVSSRGRADMTKSAVDAKYAWCKAWKTADHSPTTCMRLSVRRVLLMLYYKRQSEHGNRASNQPNSLETPHGPRTVPRAHHISHPTYSGSI